MSKSILISINPEYVADILNGYKTIEIRKNKPNIELPCKVYIYCTNGYMLYDLRNEDYLELKKNYTLDVTRKSNKYLSGTPPMLNRRVVAEFTLKNISYWQPYWTPEVMHICDISEKSCVSIEYLMQYCGNGIIYAWHIDDLKIYDEPKLLNKFFKPCDGCNKIGSSRCTDETSSDCRAKVITRPPQSWMFVESLEEK